VTGPSGSGKSTVVRRLWRELPECLALDGDLLWEPRYWNDRAAFYSRWLVFAAHISQSGRPVVVCTAAMPDDWAAAPDRVLVNDVHMIALVCEEVELRARLEARERPRGEESPSDFLEQTCNFNRWLRSRLNHVDTSACDPDATAKRVAEWVRRLL
jgi:hypothetical protein